MPTNATSHLAVRNRTALVESALGHTVDWSGLPDPDGYITTVLGDGFDRRSEVDHVLTHLLGRGAQYWSHRDHSSADLLDVVSSHCVEGRTAGSMIAWTQDGTTGAPEQEAEAPAMYRVVGWTNTAVLRGTLSRRLDSLNPVAAFRLLDQPEIAALVRTSRDYVALRPLVERSGEDTGATAGAIHASDIDLWLTGTPAGAEGVFALDVDTFRTRFAGTGVAA